MQDLTLNPPLIANLKSVDPDRYRAALFADKKQRVKLMTLYAFHAELAKVPEIVSETMLGEIRYQWWRDAVAEIYAQGQDQGQDQGEGEAGELPAAVRSHEVVTPLAALIRASDMPRFWVDKLIDGRARDLDPQPFASIEEARGYCAQTSGVLMQMAIQCLGGQADDAALAAGEAWGLTGLARSWRYYTNGMLSQLSFEQVCAAALAAHKRARAQFNGLPAAAFPAIAYAALVPKFHTRLTHSGHDAATSSIHYAPVLKQFRLMGAVITGRI